MSKKITDRRDFLRGSAGALLAGGLVGAGIGQALAMSSDPEKASQTNASPLPLTDNLWNRDAYARLQGDLNFGQEKFGWYSGKVMGVRPGEKVRELFGFEGFSMTRLVDNGDGQYLKLLREVGFYTDLKTGEVMEEYANPYTGETVPVVHIANDPFNYKIGPYYPQPPSYGGLNKQTAPKIPFILPWLETPDGNMVLTTDIHLYYPSALQPDKWPRESSGQFNRVSEMFRFVIDKEKLADPAITSLSYTGTWSRITPWLPWMLMGQSEGHINYMCIMGAYDDMSVLSPKVRAYAEANYPSYFSAPDKWEEPSLSSLERYAREQKPAPRGQIPS